MSDEIKEVPFEGDIESTAVLLLAAAEEQGLDASVVRTTSDGFLVPQSVYDAAVNAEAAKPDKAAPKKTAAKKAAASSEKE